MRFFSATITGSLYRLTHITALILLVILLFNNFALYRRKLTDPFSLMHVASIFMCLFDMLWSYTDVNPDLISFTYFNACGYALSFFSFAATLNYFFLDQFNLIPKKTWLKVLFYAVPGLVIFLICVTTPWTGLLFHVDASGRTHYMVLYNYLFNPLLLSYLFSAMAPALYYSVFGSRKKTSKRFISITLVIFAALVPSIYLLELKMLGDNEDYLVVSLACALALVHLTSNINTYHLLETRAKVEATQTDLRIAGTIQLDALPPPAPDFPEHPEINLRACMHTAREVGGDFYDYFAIDDHRLCLLIADVSGKGTPAALFMMITKTMIKDYALIYDSTSEIFNRVNSRLCEKNESTMFATSWIGILDTETMVLQYTNAGHNYPVLQHKDGSCEFLTQVHGLFLGGLDDTQYGHRELKMCCGDRLLLYTDGVTEAHNINKDLYGDDRLIEALKNTSTENGDGVLAHILDDVNAFSLGEEQFDDITMIVLTLGTVLL